MNNAHFPVGWRSFLKRISESLWLLGSLRGYKLSWLRGDLAAAATLAAIAIPEQLATAKLAGLAPDVGLIAFVAGTLAFAIFGSNRTMSIGADSTIAPIMAGSLAGIAASGSTQYASLMAALAIMVGLVLMLTKLLRLGWVADLLSIPVTTGFLAAISVHIIVGQLPTILGIDVSVKLLSGGIAEIIQKLAASNPYSIAAGVGVLATCLICDRASKLLPGALIGIAASGYGVWQLDLQQYGVTVMQALPAEMPQMEFILPSWNDLGHLMPLSLIIALVCMIQTSAVSQSFSTGPDCGGGVSRDFAAIGVGSVLAGIFGAFAVNSSPPRTAIVTAAGGRTQLSSLTAVVIIVLLVVGASKVFALVPLAALSGVLVYIGIRIFRVSIMRRIFQQSPLEFLVFLASASLVIVLPIDTGMGLSIVLSMLYSLYIIARPRCSELARIPGTTIWWVPDSKDEGEKEPGVLVYALGAPLNFMNAKYLTNSLISSIATMKTDCKLVVIEAHGVIDVDYTGSHILQRAIKDFHAQNIEVVIARLESRRAEEAIIRTGLINVLGHNRLFHSVEEAISSHKALLTKADTWLGNVSLPSGSG